MPTQSNRNPSGLDIDLKPSRLAIALQSHVPTRQPICLWGPPGIGKSDIVRQTGDALSMRVIDIRAVLLDPVDLRGLPHVNGDGFAHWAQPAFLPRGDEPTLLFLDELNRAPSLVQNALLQLTLDRRLGEYVLPESVSIVAACNRETDGGGVTRLSAAMGNRFVHLNVKTDVDDWCYWAATNGIDPLVIGFIRFRPELLHVFDAKVHAFPTPRSWSFVSSVVATNAPQDIELALIAGSVGEAAAVQFVAFAKTFRELPNIDAIIMNPKTEAVPTQVITQYAVASALAHKANDNNWDSIITYLERMPGEFMVFAVKDALARTPLLAKTGTYVLWTSRHQALI